MATRFEGAHARNIHSTLVLPGEYVGDDVVADGEVALVLNYDEAFVVQGTPAELRELLDGLRDMLDDAYLPPPA